MIRKILVAIVCLIVSVTAFAAPLTAILQSGDKFTPFYGENALVEAYNAAKDGDVITLSPGSFNTTEIAKSIKIIGSYAFGETETEVTRIGPSNGEITVSADNVSLEGIRLNRLIIMGTENLSLKRCRIDATYSKEKEGHKYHNNTSLTDCWVYTYEAMPLSNNTIIRNCAIQCFEGYNEESKLALIENCNINLLKTRYKNKGNIPNAIYRNNLLRIMSDERGSTTLYLKAPSEFHDNCFIDAIPTSEEYINKYKWNFDWSSTPNDGNTVIYKFKEPNYSEPNFGTYENYGPINHKADPSTPAIVSSSIDTETDADGNLHVKIKAEARD